TVLCSVDALQPEPVSPEDELGFVEQSGDGRGSRYSRAVFEFVYHMRLVALKGGGCFCYCHLLHLPHDFGLHETLTLQELNQPLGAFLVEPSFQADVVAEEKRLLSADAEGLDL